MSWLRASAQHSVLVVVDDVLVSSSFIVLLRRDGCRVDCASNREDALASIQCHVPTLLILDLLLPGLDGIAVLRKIRANPNLSDLAVLVVTGSESDSPIEDCIGLGVADFIHKPFDRTEMRFRIKNQLKLHETRHRNRQLQQHIDAISAAAQDAIVLLNSDGRISYWNDAAARMFDHSSAEVLGRDLHQLVVPARHLEHLRRASAQLRSNGQGDANSRTVELVARRRTGDEFPVELSLSSAQIDGQWCAVGIFRDLSERKRAESSLREREVLQRTLLENLTAGVVVIDAETRVVE